MFLLLNKSSENFLNAYILLMKLENNKKAINKKT